MELVLKLKNITDLEVLLPLLKRLDITIVKQPEKAKLAEQEQKPPLSKYIGSIPTLDAEAFEKYLQKTRDEWERPIF